jgi:hypothetical protein
LGVYIRYQHSLKCATLLYQAAGTLEIDKLAICFFISQSDFTPNFLLRPTLEVTSMEYLTEDFICNRSQVMKKAVLDGDEQDDWWW